MFFNWYLSNEKTAFVDKSRVEPTIFFYRKKISFSLKLFSGHFYGQFFIKTVRGPFNVICQFCGSSVFVTVLLCIIFVYSCFAIILKRNTKPVALLLLSYRCIVLINVLWFILRVPWVGLQSVIVVLPVHTH